MTTDTQATALSNGQTRAIVWAIFGGFASFVAVPRVHDSVGLYGGLQAGGSSGLLSCFFSGFAKSGNGRSSRWNGVFVSRTTFN